VGAGGTFEIESESRIRSSFRVALGMPNMVDVVTALVRGRGTVIWYVTIPAGSSEKSR